MLPFMICRTITHFIMIVSFGLTILGRYITAFDNIVQLIYLSFFVPIGFIHRDFLCKECSLVVCIFQNLQAETSVMNGIGFNVRLYAYILNNKKKFFCSYATETIGLCIWHVKIVRQARYFSKIKMYLLLNNLQQWSMCLSIKYNI